MTQYFDISHPGEHLAEDFLKPLGISGYRLAAEIGLPRQAVYDILKGKRAITMETSLLLDKYFGMSEGFFARIQLGYDKILARRTMAQRLSKLRPLARPEMPFHAH